MSERQNRRELMIDVAAELFQEQGYSATSVRQIADAVGVTEAALYYHFKDGKRELLQAVIEAHTPDLVVTLEGCYNQDSLADFIRCYGRNLDTQRNRTQAGRFRWLIAEYPNLSDDEQDIFRQRILLANNAFLKAVTRFIPDEKTARQVAWLLLVMLIGYGQVFINLGLEESVGINSAEMIDAIASVFGAAYGR
jgi:AcrR family transcriptional regulator